MRSATSLHEALDVILKDFFKSTGVPQVYPGARGTIVAVRRADALE